MEKFNFDRVLANFEKVKTVLPKLLANDAQNYFHKSFADQGFDGQPWAVPKRRIPGTPEYKYPKLKGLGRRTENTLVQSGALGRAVGKSIRQATFSMVRLVVGLEYAQTHNDGDLKRKIPKRQFIGQTKTLTKMQYDKIVSFIDKVWAE